MQISFKAYTTTLFPYSQDWKNKPCQLTIVGDMNSRPSQGTCETSQVLLAGMSCVFSLGYPVFAPPADWKVSYEMK